MLKQQPALAPRAPPAFRSGVSSRAFRKAGDVARQAPALRGSRRVALVEKVWVGGGEGSKAGGRARVCVVTKRQELPPVGASNAPPSEAADVSGGAASAPEPPR